MVIVGVVRDLLRTLQWSVPGVTLLFIVLLTAFKRMRKSIFSVSVRCLAQRCVHIVKKKEEASWCVPAATRHGTVTKNAKESTGRTVIKTHAQNFKEKLTRQPTTFECSTGWHRYIVVLTRWNATEVWRPKPYRSRWTCLSYKTTNIPYRTLKVK